MFAFALLDLRFFSKLTTCTQLAFELFPCLQVHKCIHFSWLFAFTMDEHPLLQFAGIFIIRSIPKVVIVIGAWIVLKRVFIGNDYLLVG